MPNTSTLVPGKRILSLVYGKSGCGKTWGALTFPRPNILDFDKGISVSRNPAFMAKYPGVSAEYEQFRETSFNASGQLTAANAFDDACRYFDTWMKVGKREQFDTWVVDTGTTLSMAARNKAVILLGKKEFSGGKNPMSHTHEAALKFGMVYPKMQDYGAERSLVEQFVDMLKDTDKHVLFLCHEKPQTDDDGNVKAIVPLLTGGSTEAVPLRFEDVWYVDIVRQGMTFQRKLITEMDGIHQCKSRLGIPSGVEWDYQTIRKALDSNITSQEKK